MKVLDDYRLTLGGKEFIPLVIGGMGVDISTPELALEACRLGGIGHISDAMIAFVSDRRYKTKFTRLKSARYKNPPVDLDKSKVKFNLEELQNAQQQHVMHTMEKKQGEGAIFINVMEKLTMGSPAETLQVRLLAALDAGIDGITLSAGLHTHSLKFMEDHPRFRNAKIGIIVSSVRALKIFLRGANRVGRLPDYVVVEGPLAGGHLGFGKDWKRFQLETIVKEVLSFLDTKDLQIPVIPAGGIFTGTDAVEFLSTGASAVQVATRFTVTKECGIPEHIQQKYFEASESDVVVNFTSPTGYPLRMLTSSPCLGSNVKPMCEPFGYTLSKEGKCQYHDAYATTEINGRGRKLPVKDKFCLCYHFSKYNCYTCGHYAYRLKDTTVKRKDGSYQVLSVEHVFRDYLFSTDHSILKPEQIE